MPSLDTHQHWFVQSRGQGGVMVVLRDLLHHSIRLALSGQDCRQVVVNGVWVLTSRPPVS